MIDVATTTNEAYESLPGVHDGIVKVAVGQGVAYLGYFGDEQTLYVHRSLDRGVSWSGPTKLNGSSDGYSIVAFAVADTPEYNEVFVRTR